MFGKKTKALKEQIAKLELELSSQIAQTIEDYNAVYCELAEAKSTIEKLKSEIFQANGIIEKQKVQIDELKSKLNIATTIDVDKAEAVVENPKPKHTTNKKTSTK